MMKEIKVRIIAYFYIYILCSIFAYSKIAKCR